ncbi:MAG: YebC/PmpR family DNA-binding transcriptional regulator [Candidatus Nucleicultricaceae bacterium]
MAGHSQFKNIMHRKGAQDAKRAKAFTKIIRELTVATKEGGADPESNPRLRAALIAAREVNMPKDNVQRAIKRAAGGEDTSDYFEVRYEGYGPNGIAIIVDCLTDNRNRTAAEVRSAFTKYGGSLGETNSVSFQFDRIGLIQYPLATADANAMFEAALEAGAEDVVTSSENHEITCRMDDFSNVREALQNKFGDPSLAKLDWRPHNTIQIEGDSARSLFKLMDVLEDNDDVQSVAANFEVDESVIESLNM